MSNKKIDAEVVLTSAPSPAVTSNTSAAAIAEVTHQEPQKGGSYTRNLSTGELIPNAPVPQPEQE